MSLIICTECGKEFSDKAPACPNCGCPTSEILNESNQALDTTSKQFNFEFESSNGNKISILNDSVCIYKKSVLKKEGQLKQLSWSDFSMPKSFLPGSINLKIGSQTFGYTFLFTNDDIEKIEKLKSISKRNAFDIMKDVSAPSKTKDNKLRCPKCNSTNIGIVGDKRKTTINLNPLKPFTLVNHKTIKENWLCYDCGHRWNKKVK